MERGSRRTANSRERRPCFSNSVALVLSKKGCATLLHDQAATEFVSNAFAHLKTITHTPEAKPLLEKAESRR